MCAIYYKSRRVAIVKDFSAALRRLRDYPLGAYVVDATGAKLAERRGWNYLPEVGE